MVESSASKSRVFHPPALRTVATAPWHALSCRLRLRTETEVVSITTVPKNQVGHEHHRRRERHGLMYDFGEARE